MSNINALIKRPVSKVFRRLLIKRRETTGLFESEWQDVSADIIEWDKIQISTDKTKFNQFKFSGMQIKMNNQQGAYNPETDPASFWYGYISPQRSLVRIEVGYLDQSLSGGIYTNTEYPNTGGLTDSLFIGIIAGDMPTSDDHIVTIPIQPLSEVFRQYPAAALTGYTSTGMTATRFLESIRDHQDGLGNYVFRPFFGDTTSGFDIATTTAGYVGLDTASSGSIANSNVWDVVEKLAEAENLVPYVTNDAVFKFQTRDNITSVSVYDFNGVGFSNTDNGINIKKISKYGLKYSQFYSRVSVKFADADTSTSYVNAEASMEVAGTSLPWLYGRKTLEIDNNWIQNSTTAQTIATTIFNQVSNLKQEIEFTAPLVPQLKIFDRITVSYDTNPPNIGSVWDVNSWAMEPLSTQTSIQSIGNTDTTGLFALNQGYRHAVHFTSDTLLTYVVSATFDLAITINVTVGSLNCHIYGNSSSTPGSLIATSYTVSTADLPANTATAQTTFTFPDSTPLSVGGQYFMMIDYNSMGNGNRIKAVLSSNTTSGHYMRISSNSGTSYTTSLQIPVHNIIMGDAPVAESDEGVLVWDENAGDAIYLYQDEFSLISIEHDLKKFETKVTARKT